MSAKEIMREAAVGGLAGLAVVVIFIVTHAYLQNAGQGDWLQFAGAMLGSAGAVSGALYIEGRKRRIEEASGEAILLDAFEEAARAISSAGAPLEGDLSARVRDINARRDRLELARDFNDFVLRQHIRPHSDVWRKLRLIDTYIDKILVYEWYKEDGSPDGTECTDETVTFWIDHVSKFVGVMVPVIKEEIETVRARTKL